MSNNPPFLSEGVLSLDVSVADDSARAPAAENTTAHADPDAIVVAFKAEWLKGDTGVLDAWYDHSADTIKCMVDITHISQSGVLPGVQKRYRGKRTEVTIFGRA